MASELLQGDLGGASPQHSLATGEGVEEDTQNALLIPGEEARLGEARRQHNAFLRARLALVGLFIGLWFLLAVIGYPMPFSFFVVLLAEGMALLAFASLVAKAGSPRELKLLHYAVLGFELVCHTAMVYFLGGLSWLGPVAYVYALMYAAVFLTLGEAALFTGLVAATYMALVTLDGTGTIPHQWYLAQGPDRYRDTEFFVTTSVAFVGVMATITFWMVFIGNEMRRERDVAIKANDELLLAQKDLRELNEELEKKVEERTRALTWRAEHDALTGLLNRSSIARRCQELLALGRRGGRSLSIVVADGDNFKGCNDNGGHAYGDEVLRALAEVLRQCARESDIVGRQGGDEFLIVLPDTGEKGAVKFCKRLLKQVEARAASWHLEGPAIPTLSLGVSVFPEHGSDVDELILIADRAMYDAKAAGGNRAAVGSSGASFIPAPREKPAPR